MEYLVIDNQLFIYDKESNTLQPATNVNPSEEATLEEETTLVEEKAEVEENERPSQSQNSKRWDDSDTLLLINLAIKYKDKFNNKRFVKREIYKDITAEMAKKGVGFTALQCENKLKFLINKYKEINDHNSKTGTERKDWKYFNLMEEFMGDRDSVKPKAKCSSLMLANSESEASSSQLSISDESDAKDKNQRKRRRLTPRGEMLTWLKEYDKKEEKRIQERNEIAERHHRETMDIVKKFLEKK